MYLYSVIEYKHFRRLNENTLIGCYPCQHHATLISYQSNPDTEVTICEKAAVSGRSYPVKDLALPWRPKFAILRPHFIQS